MTDKDRVKLSITDAGLNDLIEQAENLADDAYNDADLTSQNCFVDMKCALRELRDLRAERDALKAVLESLSTPHCILCGCKKHLDDCVIGKALAAQEPKP